MPSVGPGAQADRGQGSWMETEEGVQEGGHACIISTRSHPAGATVHLQLQGALGMGFYTTNHYHDSQGFMVSLPKRSAE